MREVGGGKKRQKERDNISLFSHIESITNEK